MRRGTLARAGMTAVLITLPILVSCGGSNSGAPDTSAGSDAADLDAASEVPAFEAAPEPDKVVATVNGVEIRAGKVYEVAALNLHQILASGKTLTEAEEQNLRVVVLGMIIDDELLTQEAEALGLQVPPEKLARQYQEIQDEEGTSEAFGTLLADRGLTPEEFRVELERRLLKQEYLQNIADSVPVTDSEARALYEANRERFQEGELAEVQQILIRTSRNDPEARRENARQRIEEAHRRAMAGEDFGALAKEFSQAPNAAKGGVVSSFPRGVMVPKFEELSFSLPVGTISEVFETPHGLNVIKVLERTEPTQIPFAEIKPNLMMEMAKQKQSLAVEAKLAELRAGADVRIVDEDYLPQANEDPTGAAVATPDGPSPQQG